MQTFDISSNSCRILAHIKHPATYHLHERCFISNMNRGSTIKHHSPHCYNLNIQKHRIMWQNDLYWIKKSLTAPRVFFCSASRCAFADLRIWTVALAEHAQFASRCCWCRSLRCFLPRITPRVWEGSLQKVEGFRTLSKLKFI